MSNLTTKDFFQRDVVQNKLQELVGAPITSASHDFLDVKGIYQIQNTLNGNSYIGLTNNIKRRIQEHRTPKNIKNKDTVLARAFRKYGKDNFTFKVLEIVDDASQLAEREMYWIEKLSPEYNMNQGGLGNLGRTLTEEQKAHLKQVGKTQWANRDENEKQRIIRKNLTGRKTGYKHPKATREKLRQANLGKKVPRDVVRKIAEANKISLRGNTNGNKAVIAISNNEMQLKFNSAVEASKLIGIHPSNITKVLKGQQKTAGGFAWVYA